MNDIEANKQIGEIEQQGVEARTFFDDYLSDQLIFRRASGKVVRARVRRRGAKPRATQPASQVGEIAPVGLYGARREPRRCEGEEAFDGRIGLLLFGHAR